MSLGTIFKLHRIEAGFTLSDIAPSIGLSLSKLSDFENNKTQLRIETILKMYDILNIDAQFPDDHEDKANELFTNLYDCILKCNDKYEYFYSQLLKSKSYVFCTSSYMIWLLGEFVYHNYYAKKDSFEFVAKIKIINDNIELLNSIYKQIYYDTLGIYFKNRNQYIQAKFYFEKALQETGTEQTLAMVYYHESMVKTQLGELTDSLQCITEAKRLFAQNLNIKRLIMSNLSLAIVNVRLGNFQKGEKLYLQCLEAMEIVHFDDITVVYNNLVWCYILYGDFEKAIAYSLKALAIHKELSYFYFYLSYASWKLNNKKNAINYIQEATIYNRDNTSYQSAMIQTFSIYVNKKLSVSKIEKMFLKVLKEAQKDSDYQIQIFVYELIIDLYTEYDNEQKVYEYKDKLIGLYRSRN